MNDDYYEENFPLDVGSVHFGGGKPGRNRKRRPVGFAPWPKAKAKPRPRKSKPRGRPR